jgi:enamine deaminase RidA (YjgF/YER057c/UK114 family)
MSKIEQRLTELGVQLPTPPAPVASYVPFTVSGTSSGKLVVISGQIPMGPSGPQYIGKLGADISLEDGKAAAKLCALNLLAQLKTACGGDLDRAFSSMPSPNSASTRKSPMAHQTSSSAPWAISASMPAPRWARVRCRAGFRWKSRACLKFPELRFHE